PPTPDPSGDRPAGVQVGPLAGRYLAPAGVEIDAALRHRPGEPLDRRAGLIPQPLAGIDQGRRADLLRHPVQALELPGRHAEPQRAPLAARLDLEQAAGLGPVVLDR